MPLSRRSLLKALGAVPVLGPLLASDAGLEEIEVDGETVYTTSPSAYRDYARFVKATGPALRTSFDDVGLEVLRRTYDFP